MEWYTIEEFANTRPVCVYHKEQEKGNVSKNKYQNIHILAKAIFWWDGVTQNILNVSGDDFYKLYCNGTYLLEGPTQNYEDRYEYDRIDVTPYLKKGENILALHLFYAGVVNRAYQSADMRLGLMVEWEDKTRNPLSFYYKQSKAYSGDLTGYDTQFLENFDSRKWESDWNTTNQLTDDWKKMKKASWADYQMKPKRTKRIERTNVVPQSIKRFKNQIFVDMGREITGNLWITGHGKKGRTVTILSAEELSTKRGTAQGYQGQDLDIDTYLKTQGRASFSHKEDYTLSPLLYELRANCIYKEIWTLDDGTCVYIPFDYKGFRYLHLICEDHVKIDDIQIWQRNYPMPEEVLTISSSELYLEDIFRICKNAVRCGSQEVYVDCPTREKGQYFGDAFITAHAQVYLTDDTSLMRQCIEQFAATSRVSKGLLGVAPGSEMQEIADFSLLFPSFLWQYYEFSKDEDFLRSYYATAKEMLLYFQTYEEADGLLSGVDEKWNLVDWPEGLRDGYDFPLTRPKVEKGAHAVLNAHYLGALSVLIKIEDTLTIAERMITKEELKEKKKSYQKAFFRKEVGLFADSRTSNHTSLHANIYSLYYDLAPKEAKEVICDFFMEKGFACGVLSSYFMLKALAFCNEYEKEYELLMNDSKNSWIEMLREGATSCMEVWQKDQKWNTSLCHPWASAPIAILVEDIAGFRPSADQKEGFYWAEQFPEQLKFFQMNLTYKQQKYQITIQKEERQIKCLSDMENDSLCSKSI